MPDQAETIDFWSPKPGFTQNSDHSLPQGYETLLGWRFGKRNLSGGQWQKLALARGLARTKARLLILDEPSASLDARTEYELFSHFRQVTKDRITVLISHR